MTNNNEKIEEKERADYSVVLEYSQKSSKKKRRLKSLALLLFNILVIGVILIIELTRNRERVSIGTVLGTWGENWYFIIALLALVAIYYLCLTFRISLLIRATTGRPRRKLSFSTAVLGKYYDNITPFGSGGQPFQMFNLGRKLDVGLATSIPTADFVVHQLVFTLMTLAMFVVNAIRETPFVTSDLIKVAAYIGVAFYAFVPLVLILFSIFPGAIKAVAKFFCKIGYKLHLIKDLEAAQNKAIAGVQKYKTSLKNVSHKKIYLVLSAVISAVCWWTFHSIPYFVLRVCGVTPDYIGTVCMSFFAYCAITVIPTPGSAGAAEGAFYIVFSSLTGGFLFWGTMLWRFCIYYQSLILGFSVTMYQYAKASRKERKTAESSSTAPPSSQTGESIDSGCASHLGENADNAKES